MLWIAIKVEVGRIQFETPEQVAPLGLTMKPRCSPTWQRTIILRWRL